MMIDLKSTITQALRSNAALASLLGRDEKGNVKVYPEQSPDISMPYVTYFELTNYENKFANDRSISSEIHFQVDVWSNGNTFPIAQAVNETMYELGFFRRAARDFNENEKGIYHKVLRYSKTHFGG
ncbi:DUF3168 domain-containing protein [Paenibacillus ihumii]|uniref:DUF3168 domain-containing protein n=1 Tax=Paenibacillus ihumii TaxID=687436 RepID=UPI0006D7D81F|nr:DUF3168 domain-containing protein [Paenibacillus ihumii]